MSKGHMPYPVNGTIESDLQNDIKQRVNEIKSTGKCKTYLNGDFTEEELSDILKDLQKRYPDKKFVFKEREDGQE